MKQSYEATAQAGKSLVRGLAAMVVVAAAMHAPPAAAKTLCYDNHYPAANSTVSGNLEVAANASCGLYGVAVTGSVIVDAGGRLTASNTTIGGNLTALNPGIVHLADGSV